MKRKSETKEIRELRKKDADFYEQIRDTSVNICEHCRRIILYGISKVNIDHILPKSLYPEFRHDRRNIQILCWDCHADKTSGRISSIMQRKIDQTKNELLK